MALPPAVFCTHDSARDQSAVLNELFKNASAIIKEARQSALGIAALVVIAVAVLVAVLFRDEVDPMARIIVVVLVLLFFVVMFFGLPPSGHADAMKTMPPSMRQSRLRRIARGAVVLIGSAVLVAMIWWAADRRAYNAALAAMVTPSQLSGWTTVSEEPVLQSDGQLSLYPRQTLGPFQTYVWIPRSRVRDFAMVRDGSGLDTMVVTVYPP